MPSEEDIRELEQFYRVHTGDEAIRFPSNYPTSCLLGSVDMTECLAQVILASDWSTHVT